ncbi:hypothetical protein FRC06_003988 [Ceratobasidium sp. 370]|nr:hypothetical protein FRC06_003988 [Ceratobasidium sp. 370]
MPLRTGVSWADAEGADEFPFPIARLDPSMEDVTVEGGADAPSEEDRSAANAADPLGSPPPQHTPSRTPLRHPVTVEEVPNEGDNPAQRRLSPRHPVTVEELPDEGDNPVGADMGGGNVEECGEPFVEEFSDPCAGCGAVAHDEDDEQGAGLTPKEPKSQTPWPNVGALMRAVDKLPHGPPWKAVTLKVPVGDEERVVVVYVRDIIGVLRELLGNPRFKRYMRYVPERHWQSKARRKRVFGEMWTGDWWWTMQMIMANPQATIAPLIIASDKTSLSEYQQADPQEVKSLSADAHRVSACRGFADVKNEKEREQLKGELVHRAMEILLEPLNQALKDGVDMYCANGRLRHVYPILAAYIVDFPEQTGDLKELDERGLKPWWPFWAHLPHVEFAGCITPNLLHQLHKGMFKSHLVKWVSQVLGKGMVDDRMAAMTQASGMRHFKKGISKVEKWTGRESKEMAMQFLPVVVETMTDNMVRLTRAMLDHMYQAHAASMTEDELGEMEAAWREFHRLKGSVVAAGVLTSMQSFNRISKLHTVGHWPPSIRELGTPDGYNSEAPEHLHIEYTKDPWRCSNGVDALPQMIKFIQRQEAVRMHWAHMDAWLALIRRKLEVVESEGNDEGSDDGGGEYDDEDDWEDVDHSEERPDASAMHYPAARLGIAANPTRPNRSANEIAATYKATDLIPALTRFLESTVAAAHGRSRPNQWDRLQVSRPS